MTGVSLVVLTLNEIDGVTVIFPKLPTYCLDEILVVDGGSTDGTVEFFKSRGVRVIGQQRRGRGEAFRLAVEHARHDRLVFFSPDGNEDPGDIPRLIDGLAAGYDMVIASRYLPPATSADDDLLTAFGNWLFTKTVNLLHGGAYTDAMVMYL